MTHPRPIHLVKNYSTAWCGYKFPEDFNQSDNWTKIPSLVTCKSCLRHVRRETRFRARAKTNERTI